ncbi:MAG TPA: peptidyl-prolyl cis-trans isomerase [Opitutaceae bacterium]|nr:peptidyl-prolyl cis-trans isomerase [Opitutaceae bacterium]
MISWIQRYFQHHFRIIFALILASTIISFIIAFAPGSNFGKTERRNAVTRPFFGYNLASQDDQGRIVGDAGLSANLQSGFNALEGADLQNYAFQRVAALSLANELHVPATTKQEIADYIKNLRAFAGQDGQFDAVRYGQFRDNLKSNSRLTEADVSRVIADDVRTDKVQRILSGPGYVQAHDVKAQLDRADSLWTLATATADFGTFNPSIPVADAALAKFYEENSFRYTIAPRAVVSVAFFPASAYTANVAVGESEVRAYYDANPGRFPNPAAKPGAKADPAADYVAVRGQVEAALKLERAQRFAVKAASDLSFALYDGKIDPGTPAFTSLLASQKVQLQSLAPFTQEDGPAELGHSPDIAAEAFKLGASRSYSDALAAPAGAVVLFWKETLPSRQPALAEVRDRVAADYTANEKGKRFVEFGRTLRSLIENRLKAGDTFEKAVASAASATSVKIECKSLAPFSRRNPPKDLDYSVAGAMERLEKGQLSDMVIAKDHGLFVYAVDKKLPDLSESSPGFAAMRAQIAAVNGRIGASARLAAMVEQELKRTEPAAK